MDCEYNHNLLIHDLEHLLQDERIDQEDFLIDYINSEYRNQEIKQEKVQLDGQEIVIQKEIDYGDITLIMLLVFFITFYVANTFYKKIRELL